MDVLILHNLFSIFKGGNLTEIYIINSIFIIRSITRFCHSIAGILILRKHSIYWNIIKPLYLCGHAKKNMAAIFNSVIGDFVFADCRNIQKITN